MHTLIQRTSLACVIAFALIACGGSDDDEASNPVATATPATVSSTSEATSTPPQSTDPQSTPTNPPAAAAGGTIVISGGIDLEFEGTGTCGDGVLGDELQIFVVASPNDAESVALQFYTKNYDGAGSYEVGTMLSSSYSSVSFGFFGGNTWHSHTDLGGTITIGSDGRSGTIETTLTSDDGSDDITVSGAWQCDT